MACLPSCLPARLLLRQLLNQPVPSPLWHHCREVLDQFAPDSLATAWNEGVERGTVNNAHAVLSQATNYASSRGHHYGAVTTYAYTWLLRFNKLGPNTLEVSKAFAWDGTGPSVLQVWLGGRLLRCHSALLSGLQPS